MNAPARIVASPERARLRVEDFMLLAEAGAFADYGKTELIDGDIYFMNAQWSRHARVKSRLFFALGSQLVAPGSDLEAMSEVSVRANGDSMPEPDIVLTRFRGEGPMPVESVALVVEVSDTTLSIDLGRKAELYAAAGVPEYWVIDVNANRALLFDDREAEAYRRRREVALGETWTAATIAGLDIDSGNLTR